MDLRSLDERVTQALFARRFSEAESILREAYAEVTQLVDPNDKEFVLRLLVEFYCASEPPRIDDAIRFSLERETVKPTAHHLLQTAMVYYWNGEDYRQAAEKATTAIDKARSEGDTVTQYAALSLLGLASLRLGDNESAEMVLLQLQKLIEENDHIIVGDETLFLERARAKNLWPSAIRQIATSLVSRSRDPEWTTRLEKLSQ